MTCKRHVKPTAYFQLLQAPFTICGLVGIFSLDDVLIEQEAAFQQTKNEVPCKVFLMNRNPPTPICTMLKDAFKFRNEFFIIQKPLQFFTIRQLNMVSINVDP